MEEAPASNLYREALHPYTKLLFSSAAGISSEESLAKTQRREGDSENFTTELRGVTRSDKNLNSTPAMTGESCSFAARCPQASERCFREHPVLTQIKDGHSIRCFNI